MSSILESRFICIGGAGTHAVSYIGAFQALKDLNPAQFDGFLHGLVGGVGTSSGAIACLCILTQLSPETMYDACNLFVDQNMAPAVDLRRFIDHYGIDDGSALRLVIDDVMSLVGLSSNTTFADFFRLTNKRFVCCATILASNTPFFFSYEQTPTAKLTDAIFMSMSIPLIFAPMSWSGNYMVDGALSCNVPWRVFPLAETFVLYQAAPDMRINSLRGYICALVCCSLSSQSREHVMERATNPTFAERSVVIQSRRSGFEQFTDTQLCEEGRNSLLNEGYAAVLVHEHPEAIDLVVAVLRVGLTCASYSREEIQSCSGCDSACAEQ